MKRATTKPLPGLISQFLQALPATGEDGFEGLLSRLLENLTGFRFHLARSGNQQGRDGRTNLPAGGAIAFECKRYGSGNPLNARELVAELQQASASLPSLDLWIVAASRTIPDQIVSDLEGTAKDKGIDILALDSTPDSSGSLDLLCAAFPQAIAEMFPSAIGNLSSTLSNIQSNQGFEQRLMVLRDRLLHPTGGWPVWQEDSKKDWQTLMHDMPSARTRLGQPLSVSSTASYSITRNAIEIALDHWWQGNRSTIFVATGEEGDGKSWSVAQWLTKQTADSRSTFPPLVFLPSRDAGAIKNVRDILEQHLVQRFGEGQWKRRFTRWLESPYSRGDGPIAVIVLDGLNERQSPGFWRDLIESVLDPEYVGLVPVICTARASYWNEHFSRLKHIPTTIIKVGPFSDQELAEALEVRGKHLSDYPDDLQPLLRKPRYLDLVTRHSQSMGESGDFTVARLIFEDWRDRCSRRDHQLSEQAFNDLLKQMALEYRSGNVTLRTGDVTSMLTADAETDAAVRELSTGGVLLSQGGRWRVDPIKLPLALGLLLCDYLANHIPNTKSAEEEIASWLEPHTGADIESNILEYAFLCSVATGLSQAVTAPLLLAWITAQNLNSPKGSSIEETIIAYLPQALAAFLSVAEKIWGTEGDNPWAQEVFLRGLGYWATQRDDIRDRLAPTLARWLSMFSLVGPRFLNGGQENSHQKDFTARIEKVFGTITVGKPCWFAGYSLEPIDDTYWLRLGRVALSVISQIDDRRPFLRALVQGILADTISESGSRMNQLSWVIRSCQDSLERNFDEHVTTLMNDPSPTAHKAAAYLLRFIGTETAWRRRESMSLDDLFPTPEWISQIRANPVESISTPSKREDIEEYARRAELKVWPFIQSAQSFVNDPDLQLDGDLKNKLRPALAILTPSNVWQGLWRSAEDLHLEQLEQVFARIDPKTIAELIRAIAHNASHRNRQGLLSFASKLDEYDLLLDESSRNDLWQLLLTSPEVANLSDDGARQIEHQLFQSALWLWSGDEQLEHQLSRSAEAFDARDFTFAFRGTITGSITTPKSDLELFRVLYYLGTIESPALESDQLLDACSSTDSLVRGGAYRYVYCCGIEGELPPEFASEWRWSNDLHFLEQNFGSLLLVLVMSKTGVGEWIERVDPSHRAAALLAANASDEDWRLYVKWVDKTLHLLGGILFEPDEPRRLVDCASSVEDLPGDVRLEPEKPQSIRFVAPESTWGGRFSEGPPKFPNPEEERQQRMSQYDRLAEQNDAAIAAGNLWLQRCFPTTGLNRAVELEPEIVRSWVSNFESNPALSSRASAFYVSLVQVLVKQDDWHEAAAKIYRKLRSKSMFVRFIDGDTQLELLDTAVFEASETAPMRDLWQERYTNCKSDRDLLDFAMLVRSAEGAPSFGWLNRHLETMMISEIPFNRAKAVAMRGFIEQDMSARWMEDIPVGDSSWMNEVRSTARERARFESFARHWFERFCAADELEEAWGAYRLFLISADRRCLLWIRQLLVEPGTSHRKAAFYDTNIQDLQRTIRENEKKMDETFVNCKVDDSLGPWMRLLS